MSEGTGNRAYLVLGSNIDPEHNLREAVRRLARYGRIVAVSSVWESPPAGFADQPNFLNAAVLLETSLSARRLHSQAVVEIERELGRVRDPANPNGPRTADLDIALFNDQVLRIDHRRIPDPAILERGFLALPLAEIAPGYVHPQEGRTLEEIAERLADNADVIGRRPGVVLAPDWPR